MKEPKYTGLIIVNVLCREKELERRRRRELKKKIGQKI